mmetsp:Transcript_1217/g.1654  ORF Transcript_1217/g.1654 Transcript_1217/m.1654 type:complete len:344 (+) Transcript_1217:2521-3552(+)
MLKLLSLNCFVCSLTTTSTFSGYFSNSDLAISFPENSRNWLIASLLIFHSVDFKPNSMPSSSSAASQLGMFNDERYDSASSSSGLSSSGGTLKSFDEFVIELDEAFGDESLGLGLTLVERLAVTEIFFVAFLGLFGRFEGLLGPRFDSCFPVPVDCPRPGLDGLIDAPGAFNVLNRRGLLVSRSLVTCMVALDISLSWWFIIAFNNDDASVLTVASESVVFSTHSFAISNAFSGLKLPRGPALSLLSTQRFKYDNADLRTKAFFCVLSFIQMTIPSSFSIKCPNPTIFPKKASMQPVTAAVSFLSLNDSTIGSNNGLRFGYKPSPAPSASIANAFIDLDFTAK